MAKTKSNAKFVVKLDGGVEGPMSGSELRDLALAGKVTPQTNIASFKGTNASLQWVPAKRVKGLFDENGKPLPHPVKAASQQTDDTQSPTPPVTASPPSESTDTRPTKSDVQEVSPGNQSQERPPQDRSLLKQQKETLTEQLADLLLAQDSPVKQAPLFKEPWEEHHRLLECQQELADQDARLVDVVPNIEQRERERDAAKNVVANEQKKLESHALELGKQAFAGLLEGNVDDDHRFDERNQTHQRIKALEEQQNELLQVEPKGIVEKTKLQAQKLKLTGEIKLTSLKVNAQQRTIGQSLLVEGKENTVHCDHTEQVLGIIADQRAVIAVAQEKLDGAERHLTESLESAATTLARDSVQGSSSLHAELKDVRKQARETDKAIKTSRSRMVALALEDQELRDDPTAGPLVKQLWSTQFDLKASQSQISKATGKVVGQVVTPRRLAITGIGILAVIVLLIGYQIFGTSSDDQVSTASTDAADVTHSQSEHKTQQENLRKATAQIEVKLDNITYSATSETPTPKQKSQGSKLVQGALPSLSSLGLALYHSAIGGPFDAFALRFTVVERLGDRLFEIRIGQRIAVLETSFTDFSTTGSADLAVWYRGTKSLPLKNGGSREVPVYQQATDDIGASSLSVADARAQESERDREKHDLANKIIVGLLAEGYSSPTYDDLAEALALSKEELAEISDRRRIVREVSSASKKGYGPFHYAVFTGNTLLIKALLETGVDAKVPAANGASAIHIAFNSRHVSTAELGTILGLLELEGISVNDGDSNGRTLLHHAVLKNDKRKIQWLRSNNADFDLADEDGVSPLHLASSKTDNYRPEPDTIQLLLDSGANTAVVDEQGKTPLHYACEQGEERVVKVLLPEVDIDAVDVNGKTALHIASESDRVSIVSLLLENNASVDLTDNRGLTALHLACARPSPSVILRLLEAGAKRSLMDANGNLPTAFVPFDTAEYDNTAGIVGSLVTSKEFVFEPPMRDHQGDWCISTPNTDLVFGSGNGFCQVKRVSMEGAVVWEKDFTTKRTALLGVIKDGTVLVHLQDSERSKLLAIDSKGKKRWEMNCSNEVGHDNYKQDHQIYVDPHDRICIKDEESINVFGSNGDHLVKLALGSHPTKFSWRHPSISTVNGDRYIVIDEEKGVMSFDDSGALLWSFTPKGYDSDSCSCYTSRIGPNGLVYVAFTSAYESILRCLDANGEVKWKLEFVDGIWTLAVAQDGTVYVIVGGGKLYAVDKDGDLLWKQQIHLSFHSYWQTPILLFKESIFVVGTKRILKLSKSGTLTGALDPHFYEEFQFGHSSPEWSVHDAYVTFKPPENGKLVFFDHRYGDLLKAAVIDFNLWQPFKPQQRNALINTDTGD